MNEIDKKIVEYLERANEVLCSFVRHKNIDRLTSEQLIEIAKMIQLEEHWQCDNGVLKD